MDLTQENLDRAHKKLDALIEITDRAKVAACNAGLTEARDRLERVGAHLRFARAEAGGLDVGGVQPRSGDK